eukprot:CAMPEP_0179895296 /NCGR_PEP_ID=MMETSP0982-20121206/35748_1 /TAXON_ID=483367 /ORGANISM="non described non described, Strain CCMP 2436" /LENGTH=56 /DNA_ID=CAMNT_0021791953 /DNA_START=189 /DNA_END=359 /DNA_ORIENTATION=-
MPPPPLPPLSAPPSALSPPEAASTFSRWAQMTAQRAAATRASQAAACSSPNPRAHE